MAERKVQSQLLVSPVTRDRVDALAVVRGEVRAEVLRVLLEDALPRFEKIFEAELTRLDEAAERFGMTRHELVRRMLHDKLTLDDLTDRRTYPRRRRA